MIPFRGVGPGLDSALDSVVVCICLLIPGSELGITDFTADAVCTKL